MSATKNLRVYQLERVEELHTAYVAQLSLPCQRAVLQMPTGTGKTVTATAFALEAVAGTSRAKILWCVGRTQLTSQAFLSVLKNYDATDRYGAHVGKSVDASKMTAIVRVDGEPRAEITFKTWQAVRNMKREDLEAYDLLIVDEFHFGGSESSGPDKKTFNKILNPEIVKKHLYVSATPWKLDAGLFAGLEDYYAVYAWPEAFAAGHICNIEFIRFESVLSIKLSNGQVLEAESTEELVKLCRESQVDTSKDDAASMLSAATVGVLMKGYESLLLADGKTPPTVVYCDGVANGTGNNMACVDEVVPYLRARFPQLRIGVVTSKFRNEDNAQTFAAFESGELDMLVTCRMAIEGFDHPPLSVVIDLAFNPTNERGTVQKFGRVARPFDDKNMAYYLYASSMKATRSLGAGSFSAETLTAMTSQVVQSLPDATPQQLAAGLEGLQDVVFTSQSNHGLGLGQSSHTVTGASDVTLTADSEPQDSMVRNALERMSKGGSLKAACSRVSLFMTDVEKMGDTPSNVFRLSDSWQPVNNKDANLAELIRMHDAGEPRPHRGTKLGFALHSYTNKNGNSSVPGLKERLSNWGSGHESLEKQKARLLALLEANGPFIKGNKDYRLFGNCRKRCAEFRAATDKYLARAANGRGNVSYSEKQKYVCAQIRYKGNRMRAGFGFVGQGREEAERLAHEWLAAKKLELGITNDEISA